MIVIDASAAMMWVFKDEMSAEGDALFDRVLDEGATVPSLFYFEVGNALAQAERRGRIDRGYSAERVGILRSLPLVVDDEASQRACSETLAIARAEQLTVYDAAYLELAVRLHGALATRDRELAAAAVRRGVTVLI